MLADAIVANHHVNEALAADGPLNSAYRSLIDNLGALGVPEPQRRWREARHRADWTPSPSCWTSTAASSTWSPRM